MSLAVTQVDARDQTMTLRTKLTISTKTLRSNYVMWLRTLEDLVRINFGKVGNYFTNHVKYVTAAPTEDELAHPIAEATTAEKHKYRLDVMSSYSKRKQAVEDLDPKVFGVIMGSVSPESLTEIKYHTHFKACRDEDNWTALLKIIKETHLSTHGQSATEHQKMQAKVEHLAAFFALTQGDLSLNVYRERFEDAVQMLENAECPALQPGQEVYTFCINLDERRYGQLQVMWQNGEVLGTNKYPDTVQAAYTIARNTVTSRGSGTPRDAKMVMAIETRISTLENASSKRSGDRGAGRAPRDAKKPAFDEKERARKRLEFLADKPCYSCGKVGNHLSTDCPNYNKLLPYKPSPTDATSKPAIDRPRRQVSFIAAADPTGDEGGDVWREVAGDEDTTSAVNDMLADIDLDELPDLDCDHYSCYMVTTRIGESTTTDHAHPDCSEQDDAAHMTTWGSSSDEDSDGDCIPALIPVTLRLRGGADRTSPDADNDEAEQSDNSVSSEGTEDSDEEENDTAAVPAQVSFSATAIPPALDISPINVNNPMGQTRLSHAVLLRYAHKTNPGFVEPPAVYYSDTQPSDEDSHVDSDTELPNLITPAAPAAAQDPAGTDPLSPALLSGYHGSLSSGDTRAHCASSVPRTGRPTHLRRIWHVPYWYSTRRHPHSDSTICTNEPVGYIHPIPYRHANSGHQGVSH
jgi:hypothetical protein